MTPPPPTATWVAASSPPPPSGTRPKTRADGRRGCWARHRRTSGGHASPTALRMPPCGVVWRPVVAWNLEPSELLPTGGGWTRRVAARGFGWGLVGGGGGSHWDVGASTISHRKGKRMRCLLRAQH